ncbi:alpha-1,4-glucan--maltose-1-phosphate maltosyltransferase [Arundinibacter roseus]|uniref:Alpha-1,4-glucan:maltose-1-phosphate maltosyltransferase n=1 Tax=Arundinibacter roseus TaxID=2070510 RepID=A0A4R4KFA2_9BACT|nr:alpha-1,4-glucan--maltose-1-phosphate maltosyltransferase [Arundinibacter roseus]TDB65281.1 alpha-1,4-glucan--maltose-1-phosphate maltosyltransferase [Arundinibacter roseus]
MAKTAKNLIPTTTEGRRRVVIEHVTPEINEGRFAVKAIPGDSIHLEADIFGDGHDHVAARLLYKHSTDSEWSEIGMTLLTNDRYEADFVVEKPGHYRYTIEAWVDHIDTWQHETALKIKDGQRVPLELLMGAQFLEGMLDKASAEDKPLIEDAIRLLRDEHRHDDACTLATSFRITEWLHRYPERQYPTRYREMPLYVDRQRAGFSAWYSMFPRSASKQPNTHGTFRDQIELLPRIADLGFDVLYVPPIHPIGHQFRKGKNNSVKSEPTDPGVPYAIGSELGGHDAINPDLGTLEDFQALIAAAQLHGMEVAMDLAIQCSPDHPWVKDHPEWFKIRPDGSIQYAENPPKKYQDIYPINFESENWQALWLEMRRILLLWAEWGIRMIRVDNPHTKAFSFWEWVIAEVKVQYPDMIFLSEAFTRPKVMRQLAKVGFTQSYTYYTWRNTKQELIEYMTELTQTEMKDYFRPNFWPNTHDINPYLLQSGHEAYFLSRYFMAATLSSNYGIFGPTYEFMVHEAFPGKEEYLNSEKYEIKLWDWSHETKLTYLIRMINAIRKENTALQYTNNIHFCSIENENLVAYTKIHANGNRLLCVVNLDGYTTQAGWVQVPLHLIKKTAGEDYRVHDLVTGAMYTWKGEWNYVELNPGILPFHLFRIEDI